MTKFQKVVHRHKSTGKKFNFQNKRGVYFFKTFRDFFPSFVAGYPKFTEHTCTSLIFKPRKDLDMNCYCDFDFKGREPISLETNDLAKFAKKVSKIIGSPKFLVTKRVSSYFKTTKNEQYHSYGFHLWFFGKFSLVQCKLVRDTILSQKLLDPLRKKYNFYNSDPNAVDKGPILRSNGLYITGDRKTAAGPHFICYANGKELEYGWQAHAGNQDVFCKLLEEMYLFIWEPAGKKQVIPHEKPETVSFSAPNPTFESRFNLPLFLEITKGHVANNTEWKQLVVFFASQGLDCRKTNDLLENAWEPFKHMCN